MTINNQRRQLVKMMGASLVLMNTPMFAKTKKGKPAKVVWVLLRGAMDSLHTVIPTQESQYKVLRPKLANGFDSTLLKLNSEFSLHPALQNLHDMYLKKQLLPIVAVGSGFSERSHFDGQDYLESGLSSLDHDNGWLARAIEQQSQSTKGIAIANSVPISMRGSEKISTWFPSQLKDADENIYEALLDLYQGDNVLLSKLEEGLNTQAMADNKVSRRKGKFVDLARSCAKLLANENDINCAMLEVGGWDTHNNQVGRLNRQLQELDSGIAALKSELSEQWQDTVVIVATEFGRTAKENGTGGTDHGSASAMFVAGGAVQGGQVLGQWPGLNTEQLYKKRDLMPTSNIFSWIGTILQQHWQLSEQQISDIFPNNKAYKNRVVV